MIKGVRQYFIFLTKYLFNINNYLMYKNVTNYLKGQGEDIKTGLKDYFNFSLGLCLNDLDT